MTKRLKHYQEVQIMRNNMEQVIDSNGSVDVSPKEVYVGESDTFTITYTVGKDTLYDGGVIRFTIPFGFTKPQSDIPVHPGYTSISTDRDDIKLSLYKVENNWWTRGPDRTKPENVSEHVGTHIWAKVSCGDLHEGDKVILTYGDASYHKQASAQICRTSGPVQFDVATDAKGDMSAPYSGYYLTENPPTVMVYPKKAKAFEFILPSEATKNKDFNATVFAIDCYHNLASSYVGEFICYMGDKVIYEGKINEDDCGVKKFKLNINQSGTKRFTLCDKSEELKGKSNSVVICDEEKSEKHFWGDMHGHTGIQWGRGSGRSYYEFAKEVASVDFCALTDPDSGRYTNNNETAHLSLSCYMTDTQWKEIQDINKEYHEEGKFIPILAYEYHNDAPNPEFGGDRNVYYESYDEPIRRCVDEGSYTPKELWAQIKENNVKAITIPHHTAKKVMLGSWEMNDEKVQRLVEIYSSWGSSECEGCEFPIIGGSLYENHSVHYGLSKGYHLGFVAGSDTHAGAPGYCYWVFSENFESYRGGLTCVLANSLTKENVFNALYNRKCYATSGERIILDFTLNSASMGDIIPLEENSRRELNIDVKGTDEIEFIEIISNGEVIFKQKCSDENINITFVDDSDVAEGTYYYVRVRQKNKAVAWSSPIWLE